MLEARSLTKYYNHTPAVRQVSFTIRPGEILGYLGPNGAGKSTTVKMLTGLIEPSEGQIFYRGRSVYEDFTAFQRRIGYVPEEAHLYPHLTGREYLQLMGRLRGMPRRVLEPKMDEFLRAFALWDDRHAPLSAYSKGMRQKILLSAALLHDPDVLILDEPFSGLDVTSALTLRSLLRSLAGRGKIILYSSHVLEVVEKICSTVLILRNGEVAAYDSIERLRELMSQPSLEAVFAQLAQVDDGEVLANRIVDAMSYQGTETHPGYAEVAAQSPDPPENTAQSVSRHAADVGKDVRYALRSLAGSPGFTAVALLSLSLGICIVTCAFSEMNGMALRSLPAVENPQELVALQLPASYPSYQRYRAHNDVFSSTGAYVAAVPFGVSLGGRTERKWGHLVTPSYFSTLGVRPALGRFLDEMERPGAITPLVVSYRFWQEQLASDPSAIGKTLRVNSQPATIVGVGPKEFLGASPLLFGADLWMPLSVGERVAPELGDHALERRDRTIFRIVGRLRPGATTSRAEAELDATAQQIEQENGDPARTQKGRRVLLVEGGKLLPLSKQDLPFFTSFFTVMSGLIMLIACANVANMMLARAAGRRKEIAVRLALGASRARLVRQLLTESMIVVAGAAVPGFLASMWLMHLLTGVRMPLLIPVTFDFQPDGRVLLLTIVFTGFTGLVFGLVPALQGTRTDLAPALKEGGAVRLPGRHRWSLRNILMVGQFAGSLTLLVILGMLSLGIQTTLGIQAGFKPKNLYLMSLDPIRDGYSAGQTAAFLQKLLDRVKVLPSVTAASLTESVPVSIGGGRVRVSTPGDAGHQARTVIRHVVGKDYFDTTGIAVAVGRAFRREDETSQTAAVIVSQEFARQFWPGSDPLGRQIEIGSDEVVAAKVLPGSYDYRVGAAGARRKVFEVVGVAGDVAEGLVVQKPSPAVYFPLQSADYVRPAAQGMTLMVRAAPGVDAVGAVRREMSAMDANIAPFNIRSMPEQIDQFMAPLRMASWTYGFIGYFWVGPLIGRAGRDDGVFRGPARAGDRHSHCLGRAARQRVGVGDEGRHAPGGGRHRHWAGRCVDRIAPAIRDEFQRRPSHGDEYVRPETAFRRPATAGLPGANGVLCAGPQIAAHRPGGRAAPGVRTESMREWLRETHGPGFELLRHFLLRFFDSDLVTAPGQTATALIGAFSIFLPWFPLIVGPLRHKYAYFSGLPVPGPYRQAVRADELWLITLMMSAIGLLTAIKWQSLFPGLRDYRALGSLPLRARQIFAAKLLALLVVATAAVVTLNLFPSLMFPLVSASRWAFNPSPVARLVAHAVSFRGGLLFLLLWTGCAARCAVESAAPAPIRAGDGVLTGTPGGNDADSDRLEFLHPGANRQHGGPAGTRALASARVVPGASPGHVGRSGPGDAGAGAPGARGAGDGGGAGPGDLHGQLSAPSRIAGGGRRRSAHRPPMAGRRLRLADSGSAPAGCNCIPGEDPGGQQSTSHDPDGLWRLWPRDLPERNHRHARHGRSPAGRWRRTSSTPT